MPHPLCSSIYQSTDVTLVLSPANIPTSVGYLYVAGKGEGRDHPSRPPSPARALHPLLRTYTYTPAQNVCNPWVQQPAAIRSEVRTPSLRPSFAHYRSGSQNAALTSLVVRDLPNLQQL